MLPGIRSLVHIGSIAAIVLAGMAACRGPRHRGWGRLPPSSAAVTAADVVEPEATDPLGDDRRATPRWAYRVPEPAPPGAVAIPVVPQLDDVGQLYASMEERMPTGPGVLVCRIELARDGREWDPRGVLRRTQAPDMTAYVQLGAGTEVAVVLPENRFHHTFSLPLRRLAPGDALRVRLVERDAGTEEPIATLAPTVGAEAPYTAAGGGASLACRLLPRSTVRIRADAHLADAALRGDRAERVAGNPRLADEPAASDRMFTPFRGAIRRSAALLGFADPRVVERVAEYDRALATLGRQRDASIAARLDEASTRPEVVPIGLDQRARVLGASCTALEEARARCRLRLEADYLRIPEDVGYARPPALTLFVPGRVPVTCSLQLAEEGQLPLVRAVGPVEHHVLCTLEGSDVPTGRALVALRVGVETEYVGVVIGVDAGVPRSR